MDDVLLRVDDVTLELDGNTVLDHLSFDLWKGHVHALVGPNGAGKSTTARMIMGLGGYADHSGDVLFRGESVKGLPVDERARRGITLAWQEPARFEGLGIDAFLRAAAKDTSDAALRRALEDVGLAPDLYMKRAVDETLSGGERKRVELASIMVMEPELVLMDEPDSGIDVGALEHIFAALAALRERGATVVMITHSPVVLQHAEHAFLICCGQIVEKGSIEKIRPYFENKCIPCDHKNEPDEELETVT